MKKRRMLRTLLLSVLLFFCVPHTIYSTIKGSETVLSVEPFYTFPAADSDNTMLGFGWFKNGFALEDVTTSCTFDSVFPVSGDVYLNGGDLHLGADLLFRNMSTWYTSGTIYGNDYLVDFCSSVTGLGSTMYDQVFDNAQISINSDLVISGSVTFCGDCFFNGHGKRILLGDDGYLLVESGASVTFKDVYIDGIVEGKICCLDDSAGIVLDDVRWIQDADYSFTQGSLRIFNTVDFAGTHTFFYQSSQTSTIDTHSFWNLFQGIRLSIGRKTDGGPGGPEGSGGREPIYFVDETSVIKFENACLSVTPSGMSLLHGLMILDRGVEVEVNSTDSTHGLIIGDGTAAGDMEFRFHPGARVLFSKGPVVYENTDPTSFRSRSGEATFVRAADSIFYLNRDVQLQGIVLDTNPSSQLYVADGKELDYVGCRILYPGIEFELGGTRYNDYTNLMKGGDEMFLVRGTLTPYTYIQNGNNTLHGNGDISGKIILQDSSAALTVDVNGIFSNDIDLNGGSLVLGHDAYFSQDATINGPGSVNIGAYTLGFGINDMTLTDTICWIANGGGISVNSQISLSATWTIEGTCIFDGDGQTLVLEPGGEIVLVAGATLKMRKLRVEGISGNNIRCLDGQGTLELEDVVWMQDGDFTFMQGCISMHNQVDFLGKHTFAYESANTSTINVNSEWRIADGMTIVLGKTNGVEPLYMTDDTSVLHLDNCTLSSNANGAMFTNGTMLCHHEVMLDIPSTDSTNGIVLGTGVAGNDIDLVIEAGASVHFLNGHLVYNVTNDNCLKARGSGSRLIRYGGTSFYINDDITLTNINIVDENYTAAMIVADGKKVTYDNVTFEWPGVGIAMTGQRYNFYTNLLAGDDEIFLLKGTLAAYALIMGTGNLIHGGGSLAGQIVLSDSNAGLQFKVQGPLLEDVILNGGTVTLLSDLMFSHGYQLEGSGTVALGSNNLMLGSAEQSWSGDIYWNSDNGHIDMNSKIDLTGTWTFNGDCVIHGNNNTLIFSTDSKIVIDYGSSLTFKDIKLEGVCENNIRCFSDSSQLCCDNVLWIQDGHYSFTMGSLSFRNKNNFSGSYTFSYESSQTSTIQSNSKWCITDDLTLSIGRKEAVDYVEPLILVDETSVLKFNNSSFVVTASGMCLTNGTFAISHDVHLDINSTDSTNGLVLGDGVVGNDVIVQLYPGAAMHCMSGHLVIDETDPTFLSLTHGNARVIRYPGSTFYMNQNVTISNLVIDTDAASTMIVKPGKSVSYENCSIETVYADFTLTGMRGNDYVNFLMGDGDVYLHKGTLPVLTYIWGTGNVIRGNGNISGPIALQNAQASVSFDMNGSILNDITMNGGTITLADDLYLVHDKVLLGSGKVVLGTESLDLGAMDKSWTGTVYWDGTEGHLHLNSNLSLGGKWTFSGTCVVHGNWKIFELLPGAEVVVERGSTLILREMKIKDLAGYNIRCLDEHSSILYDDCKARMSANYSFTQGRFDVQELLEIHGDYTFAYQSAQQSVIYPCTSLRMTEGTTLSYAPLVPLRDRLMFYNVKSKLELDDATLHSTTTGLQLTKGMLEIEGDSYIASDATVQAEGIEIGDGISAANNMYVDILPSADLEITSGYVVNKNVV